MRAFPATLLIGFALMAPACGGTDEPIGGDTGGGAAGDAAAGSGGSAGLDAALGGGAGFDASLGGSAGFDASTGGSAGLDAGAGGSAGQSGGSGGTGGTPVNPNFDCPALGASDAGAADAATDAAMTPDAGATVRLRVVAANVTSGNFQSYEAPGIRILQGLAPDIVMIQELKYQSGTLRDLVDTAFGAEFCFFRETQVGGIPNGVVSRYPIVDHGEWQDDSVPDRDFAWARIDVPGPVDLWAVSVHWKTASSSTRAVQAQALVGYVQAQVPTGDYLVIGGDLNTDTTTETSVGTLSSVVVTTGPRPVDQNDNDDTNANRNKPYDWVLPSSSFASHQIPVVLGASTYPAGLVFDTRIYTPLSEAAPAQLGDSGVSGMQHMAVVKDFALPATP